MTDCPPRENLDRLLRDELPGVELSAIAEHVERCARCQEELDQLGRAEVEPEVRLLRGAGGDAAPVPASEEFDAFLSRIGRELASPDEPSAPGRSRPTPKRRTCR